MDERDLQIATLQQRLAAYDQHFQDYSQEYLEEENSDMGGFYSFDPFMGYQEEVPNGKYKKKTKIRVCFSTSQKKKHKGFELKPVRTCFSTSLAKI